jgi:hypothetical protein
MALLLDCQLVPIPLPFAVCVQIDLWFAFWLSSPPDLVTERGFFLLLRCRSDLLARGWGSAFPLWMDRLLACFQGLFFFKMNFSKVLPA